MTPGRDGPLNESALDPGDFPAWTRHRPLLPWCLLFVMVTIFPAAHLLFDSIYAARYGYHVPLVVGAAYGLMVARRVRQMREMAAGVPRSSELISRLCGGLARPPLLMKLISSFGPAVVLLAANLGLVLTPYSTLYHDFPLTPDARAARMLLPFVVFFLMIITGLATFTVAAGLTSRRWPGPLEMQVPLFLIMVIVSHHVWGQLQVLTGLTPYLLREPSFLMWSGEHRSNSAMPELGRRTLLLLGGVTLLYGILWLNRLLGLRRAE